MENMKFVIVWDENGKAYQKEGCNSLALIAYAKKLVNDGKTEKVYFSALEKR